MRIEYYNTGSFTVEYELFEDVEAKSVTYEKNKRCIANYENMKYRGRILSFLQSESDSIIYKNPLSSYYYWFYLNGDGFYMHNYRNSVWTHHWSNNYEWISDSEKYIYSTKFKFLKDCTIENFFNISYKDYDSDILFKYL